MPVRLLITCAGSGPANNFMRSLRAGERKLTLVGAHHDRFLLKKSGADHNYLIPAASTPGFLPAIRRVVEAERIDVLVPTSDADVAVVSRHRRRIPCRLFLPRHRIIRICQDKYQLGALLGSRGVPVPRTYPITSLGTIAQVFRRLGSPRLAWCRTRFGTSSRAALSVKRPAQARAWIDYWREMQGVAAREFTLSEYLPGRDFGCQSLWREGELLLVKSFERLSYITAGGNPSGVSSAAALAKAVIEPRVADVCAAAVRALDRHASGLYSIDLKENAAGTPCVTEINAGRPLAGTNLLDLTGKHNMATAYVRIALGEPVELHGEYDGADAWYMVRDLDTLPDLFHAEELFEGIVDARG
jgi:carbamoyl-phosphate synthase large subunit